jgi:hypothetical protein
VSTGGDTGGTLELVLKPIPGDTGEGFVFASHGLTPQFTKAVRQPQHGLDGAADPADTGAGPFGVLTCPAYPTSPPSPAIPNAMWSLETIAADIQRSYAALLKKFPHHRASIEADLAKRLRGLK